MGRRTLAFARGLLVVVMFGFLVAPSGIGSAVAEEDDPGDVVASPMVEPTSGPDIEPTETAAVETATATEEPIVQAAAVTGSVSKVESNTTPVPGEDVTFTITLTGTADAGTILRIDDVYQLPYLTPAVSPPANAFTVVSSTNLAMGAVQPDNQPGLGTYYFHLYPTVQTTGAFSLTVTTLMHVADDAASGQTINARVFVNALNQFPDPFIASDLRVLTVAAAPPTATSTPTNTPTATATATATNTATATATNTATATATATNTATPTNTPMATATATDTATATATNTATPTNTATNTPTATPTNTPTATATSTLDPTATNTPMATETSTAMPTNTPMATAPATRTPNPVETATTAPLLRPTVVVSSLPKTGAGETTGSAWREAAFLATASLGLMVVVGSLGRRRRRE